MKDLLAKLLGMFHKPEPTKPVEPVEAWPFPVKTKTTKKQVKKPAVKKPAAKKTTKAKK
jgi:hypothetical protein